MRRDRKEQHEQCEYDRLGQYLVEVRTHERTRERRRFHDKYEIPIDERPVDCGVSGMTPPRVVQGVRDGTAEHRDVAQGYREFGREAEDEDVYRHEDATAPDPAAGGEDAAARCAHETEYVRGA